LTVTGFVHAPHAYRLLTAPVPGSVKYFCVFDLETTDKLNNEGGKVMQLAARRYAWNMATGQYKLVAEMNVLMNDPTMTFLHPKAFETHGISIADCRDPRAAKAKHGSTVMSPTAAWRQFLAMVDGAILMGQNLIDFDIPFTNRELARFGIRAALDPNNAIDTLLVARDIWSMKSGYLLSPFKLRSLADRLGVKTDPTLDHNALGDIDTCWKVFIAMLPELRSFGYRFVKGQPDQYKGRLDGLRDGREGAWARRAA
jgi:DNA polymerase III alpha subunit (gram-positive type)